MRIFLGGNKVVFRMICVGLYGMDAFPIQVETASPLASQR